MKEEKSKEQPAENEVETVEEETISDIKKEDKKPEKKQKSKKDSVVEKTEQLEKQLEEQKDLYLRLRAEYDNFRKRSQKEKEDVHTTARADVIKNILPVLDNFERAAGNSEASFEDYRKGMEMIYTQFLEILEKTGVESFGEPGDAFDPNMHNAVMHIESEDFGENELAQVFQKGYKIGNTVVRFATVQVAN
ncbi:MAG: nucleotide exchange factor GrpE [Clostridia bacterium]|nr:nucleotide exchange factor GrpE [Clostridia bacterium]